MKKFVKLTSLIFFIASLLNATTNNATADRETQLEQSKIWQAITEPLGKIKEQEEDNGNVVAKYDTIVETIKKQFLTTEKYNARSKDPWADKSGKIRDPKITAIKEQADEWIEGELPAFIKLDTVAGAAKMIIESEGTSLTANIRTKLDRLKKLIQSETWRATITPLYEIKKAAPDDEKTSENYSNASAAMRGYFLATGEEFFNATDNETDPWAEKEGNIRDPRIKALTEQAKSWSKSKRSPATKLDLFLYEAKLIIESELEEEMLPGDITKLLGYMKDLAAITDKLSIVTNTDLARSLSDTTMMHMGWLISKDDIDLETKVNIAKGILGRMEIDPDTDIRSYTKGSANYWNYCCPFYDKETKEWQWEDRDLPSKLKLWIIANVAYLLAGGTTYDAEDVRAQITKTLANIEKEVSKLAGSTDLDARKKRDTIMIKLAGIISEEDQYIAPSDKKTLLDETLIEIKKILNKDKSNKEKLTDIETIVKEKVEAKKEEIADEKGEDATFAATQAEDELADELIKETSTEDIIKNLYTAIKEELDRLAPTDVITDTAKTKKEAILKNLCAIAQESESCAETETTLEETQDERLERLETLKENLTKLEEKEGDALVTQLDEIAEWEEWGTVTPPEDTNEKEEALADAKKAAGEAETAANLAIAARKEAEKYADNKKAEEAINSAKTEADKAVAAKDKALAARDRAKNSVDTDTTKKEASTAQKEADSAKEAAENTRKAAALAKAVVAVSDAAAAVAEAENAKTESEPYKDKEGTADAIAIVIEKAKEASTAKEKAITAKNNVENADTADSAETEATTAKNEAEAAKEAAEDAKKAVALAKSIAAESDTTTATKKTENGSDDSTETKDTTATTETDTTKEAAEKSRKTAALEKAIVAVNDATAAAKEAEDAKIESEIYKDKNGTANAIAMVVKHAEEASAAKEKTITAKNNVENAETADISETEAATARTEANAAMAARDATKAALLDTIIATMTGNS